MRPGIRKAYTGRDKSHTDTDNLLNKGHPLTCDPAATVDCFLKLAGIAQLVECLTEKPGAILTWV